MDVPQITPQYALLAVVALITCVAVWSPGRKSSLDNLPGPPPTSWLSGNLKEFLGRDCWAYRAQNAREYGRISKLHGLFARDAIIQRLPASGDSAELDMLSWMGRTTLEIIGQAGFGHTFDDFTSDAPGEFATAVKSFFPQMMKSILIRVLLPFLVNIGTAGFRRRVVELIPLKDVQRMRYISDVMYERSVQIFNEKKAALEKDDEALKQEIGEGRDIMSILLRANLLASDEDRLPDDELIGQVTTMVLAGMDTTANSIARILLVLSERQDVQEKLRAEILQALEMEGGGETLGFDKLMELPYLEAVCRELFRLYPSVTFLFREATKDMLLPLSEPIRMLDGSLISSLPIPKGTRLVPNMGQSNIDPALWGPDAEEWRPERWLEPLPRAVEDARIPGVYSHMMTFLGGNKACLGFKFAQVELKVVLLVLLQSFKFEPTGKPIAWNNAPVQYPTVGKISEEPALPLKVSLLRP
ncbi:cytochrome P450 [Ganoderma sinense ZZ0214-1]|uniref:Cytochrome P450 n=1 Tax=Ganoderma sinense ZZ0214-1 TaxID=1077348 RepID=A0A2G8SET1_9APHY|nr:cytochrome P450 [Ganoderma sinense ZZ0214-1]